MSGNKLQPREALNKAYLKVKPDRESVAEFKTNLVRLIDLFDSQKDEEFNKNLLIDFLKKSYYGDRYFINTKDRSDLVIHNGDKSESAVGVIFETKKPTKTNSVEMPTVYNLNKKAFQQLVLYFLRERITCKNVDVKHLVVTNFYEWFIFDAKIFEDLFYSDNVLKKRFTDFEEGRMSGKKTDFFYKQKFSIEQYRDAVQTYRSAESKAQKREMESLIAKIKTGFSVYLGDYTPNQKKLLKLEQELAEKEYPLLFESETDKKAREKRITKLNNEIDKLQAEIADIESGRIYSNALEWRFEFPEVLNDDGDFVGFDVVIGNPPYIRQEEIKELKPTLQQNYQCYTGVVDLFVYFYELGLNLLKAKGHLTYISSNKYFRAGYGEKLRQFLTDSSIIHNLIDFGDFPVFEEAIAYPSIITLSKAKSENNQVQTLSWDETKKQDIAQFATVLEQDGLMISQENLKSDGWRLESSQILDLLAKLRNAGKPLGEYVNGKFYYGIKTGFNEAFVIDRATRDRLINEHPSSVEVIKPFLRGRDVKRWNVDFADQYLIKIESSENKKHTWSELTEKEAEKIFNQTYPAIYKYFSQFRESLIKRCDQGRFFWELRSCIYWQEFEQSKIIYPDIYEHQSFAIDILGFYSGNTCYFIPIDETWLCGLLNSQLIEWFYTMITNSIRGGYLRAFSDYMKQIPIPNVTKSQRSAIEKIVDKCLDAKKCDRNADTSELENAINRLVYKLYQLTYDEVKIIDPKFELTEQQYTAIKTG